MKTLLNILSLVIFFFITFLITYNIYPQQLVWHHLAGPMGGTIGDIAINSNGDIFAGVYWQGWGQEGLYRSTDKGVSWNKIETQFYDFIVYDIYITRKGHIWIGNADNPDKLHRSTDNGLTWEVKKNGYGTSECWAIGENKEGILFAGNADGGGIYRSTNEGDNWVYISNVSPLVIATDSNNVTYAGTFSGLYSTTDSGITWINDNFFQNIPVASILIDERNNIYCGTGYYNNGNGVFYSSDGGDNWTQIGLAGEEVLSLAFDSIGSLFAGTLSNGLFKTTDLGQNWEQYQQGLYRQEIYRLAINNQDEIFVGSEGDWLSYGDGGVFRSTDGGISFKQVGLPISNVKNIVFSSDSLIIASTPSGVQKYNRVTKDWSNLGLYKVEAVTITPSNIIYAATWDEGLFKSADMGKTWTLTNLTADTLMSVYNVLAVNDDTLFASTFYNLRRSFDGGENWNRLSIISGWSERGLFFENNNLWAIGFGSNESVLYKSSNFGSSFESIYSGFGSTNSAISPLFVTNNGYIFLVSDANPNGIIRSTDNGINWEQVLFDVRSSTVYAKESGLVITGKVVDSSDIYLSNNYGNNWTILKPPSSMTYITDIRENTNGNLFFATRSEGLYEIDLINSIENELNNNFGFYLYQNYPNPFNSTTKVKYSIYQSGIVQIKLFDVLGKEIKILINEFKPAGKYEIEFNAGNFSSGVYFYEIKAGNFKNVKKLILLK